MKKLSLFALAGCMVFIPGISEAESTVPGGKSPEIRKKLASFKPGISREMIYNTGFEPPFNKGKKLSKGFSLPREGINGNTGLKYVRNDANEYTLFAIPLNLKPGKKYTIEFYARGENLQRSKGWLGPGIVFLEYYTANGKYVGGQYPDILPGTEFKKYTVPFSTKGISKKFDNSRIGFYLRKGWTGTIWIDDLTVTSGSGETHAVVINEPKMLTFCDNYGKIKLVCNPRFGGMLGAHVTLRNGGKVHELLLKSDKNGFLTGDFDQLTPGKAVMDIQLLDLKKKLFLEKQQFNLSVRPANNPIPAHAALLDKHGRVIINGKPFMPIGCYAYSSKKTFKMLADAGFNCFIDYTNIGMAAAGKFGSQRANILATLDLAHSCGLKNIFSFTACEPGTGGVWFDGKKGELDVLEKIVSAIKNHPALLAYYIGDERPLAALPSLMKMRESINRLDIWHPTWAVTTFEQLLHFPQYAVCADIFGFGGYPFGHYPIRDQTQIGPSMKKYSPAYNRIKTAHTPVWSVPQMFNWGTYKAKDLQDYKTNHRWPTLEEMRMQTILHAILGAKAFIYYSQFDILKTDKKFEPGVTEKRWVMAKDITSMLHKLEPFLMGVGKVPEIKVTTDKKDNLQFRAFTSDDGKLCILAVAFEPVKAIFHVPGNVELRSQYGRFKKLGNGRWQFTADGIGSDILLPAN